MRCKTCSAELMIDKDRYHIISGVVICEECFKNPTCHSVKEEQEENNMRCKTCDRVIVDGRDKYKTINYIVFCEECIDTISSHAQVKEEKEENMPMCTKCGRNKREVVLNKYEKELSVCNNCFGEEVVKLKVYADCAVCGENIPTEDFGYHIVDRQVCKKCFENNERDTKKAEKEKGKFYKLNSIETVEFLEDQNLPFHLTFAISLIVKGGHKGWSLDAKEDIEDAIYWLDRYLNWRGK